MRKLIIKNNLTWFVAAGLFLLCSVVYASRMAPSVVPGDPGEYQIIASGWGIGHPPGYGFYALLGNLFTHLLPLGTFAWRANFLSVICGATIVLLAYGMGRTVNSHPANSLLGQAPPVLGALSLAAGILFWQHALHANAHIVTALLATLSLFTLLRWWRAGRDRWLYLFCIVAGVSPVQHPLLVFAFPAYTLFILAVRPRILLDWRTLLKMVGCALVGLAAFLYYPIRCAIGAPPLPGPSDMHTWQGFVRVVTAQGLRVNLFTFSLRDILYRLWDVRVPLGLQYAWPILLLAAAGLVLLWRRCRSCVFLFGVYGACIVLITVNVQQDAGAYLLGPLVAIGVLAGYGVGALIALLPPKWPVRRWVVYALLVLAALLPVWSAAVNWTRMDLSDYDDATAWLRAVEARFVGQGQGAALLTEWERMTTVYYYQQIEGRAWSADDIRFVYIWAGKSFVSGIEENLASGPVYLTMYRPTVVQTYRLMPSGAFWQALPAWPHELPEQAQPVDIAAPDQFEIVGWRVDRTQARPGDVLTLDLYMRLPHPQGAEAQQYYLPWARLGPTTYRFTTDSRFNTPWWGEGEIVGQRFELPVPWHAEPGRYPLQVGVRWVNQGEDLVLQDGGLLAPLAEIEVLSAADWRPEASMLQDALGNFGGDILLRGACINGRRLPTEHQIDIQPGRTLRVTLAWESLRPIEQNNTVFVQLLDLGLQVRAQRDSPPLGGSAPTLLWFPRWRQGTRITDTYLLDVPPDLPSGQYPLVVGMYGFSTQRRVQVVSPGGDMDGDWVTLTHLWVR